MEISDIAERVIDAGTHKTALNITGGGSKSFLGREIHGDTLSVAGFSGIVNYDPSELVVTVRAGTPLATLVEQVSEQGQMLPFEPPAFGVHATVGGMVAAGLSGPRRAFTGSVRDYVLGIRCINGKGEVLEFGGQVMKNVAGYDASRLLTGSMGTLAVILEVSFKVLPKPQQELTLAFEMSQARSIQYMVDLGLRPLPVSASCHYDGRFLIRLSGSEAGVLDAHEQLGGEVMASGNEFWRALKEQEQPFFNPGEQVLWRISVPTATSSVDRFGDSLIEWGGGLRWVKTDADAVSVRTVVEAVGGTAMQFRNGNRRGEVYHPLDPIVKRLNGNLKNSFDPLGIFGPDRMYPDF